MSISISVYDKLNYILDFIVSLHLTYTHRCIEFHPDGNYLFSGTQDMLHVFGWEPVRCYDTFAMGWGKVADMAVANTQLIGAAYSQTNVSVHVVDLSVSYHQLHSKIHHMAGS